MSQVINIAAATSADRGLLGNKGAGLARMLSSGLRVPPAFVITTDVCRSYLGTGTIPAGLSDEVEAELAELERRRGRRLSDPDAPLLVSVRSGASVSMPGMMDTVLNLGVTPETRPGLARHGGQRFALDAHRRFLESFGTVVLGIPQSDFDGVAGERLSATVAAFSALVAECGGLEVLHDPRAQLHLAIEAVFRSWNSPRARTYRALKEIPDDLGTAVVVQSMVFGNLNHRSGSGVAFTRDPNTGESALYGDFLFLSQGEDVVAGRHKTLPLAALAEHLPAVWAELRTVLPALERQAGDMLDVEFTVEDGTLYVLQMRSGKRAAEAAVGIAVDLAREGVIDRAEAIRRISTAQLERLNQPHLDPAGAHRVAAVGLGASPGVATGMVCVSADRVAELADENQGVILTRTDTSPADVHGMAVADGVLTSRGGLVSHAAVVARDLGVPAVVGVDSLVVDEADRCARIGELVLREGDLVTIDGGSGEVVPGRARMVAPTPTARLAMLLDWADELSRDCSPGRTPAVRLSAARSALGAGLLG